MSVSLNFHDQAIRIILFCGEGLMFAVVYVILLKI